MSHGDNGEVCLENLIGDVDFDVNSDDESVDDDDDNAELSDDASQFSTHTWDSKNDRDTHGIISRRLRNNLGENSYNPDQNIGVGREEHFVFATDTATTVPLPPNRTMMDVGPTKFTATTATTKWQIRRQRGGSQQQQCPKQTLVLRRLLAKQKRLPRRQRYRRTTRRLLLFPHRGRTDQGRKGRTKKGGGL
jgi:hypothetical protein